MLSKARRRCRRTGLRESLISTHCVQELNSSSRYRYQLEAFVDKVKGREPRDWVTGEDSIKNMECLDMVYEKVSHFYPLRL